MKNSFLTLSFYFLILQIFAQNAAFNIIELHNLNPNSSSVDYNDVWGLEKGGKQYAIWGSNSSIYIADVSNCNAPSLLFTYSPGSTTVWRDFKTRGNFIFGVCDSCNEGLVVIDGTNLPTSAPIVYQSTTFFNRAHNIYIDGDYLYAVGTDTQPEGMVIIDISTPSAPTLEVSQNLDILRHGTNTSTNYYIHDINVINNIAYASHGWWEFAAWDVSALPTISFITSYQTGNYTHSSWNNVSNSYAYVCEEVPLGKPVQILSLNNLSGATPSITYNSSFMDPLEGPTHTNLPPHNPFVKDDSLFISYYHDGLKVYDISTPTSPSLIAYYDTYPDNDGSGYSGYQGNWGTYPYLSNGCILASDIKYGLLGLRLDFTLPVNWGSFEVMKIENKNALIEWTTLSERNNSHFEILRSENGINFEIIKEVKGNGDTDKIIKYKYIDDELIPSQYYYKIRQVDYNGDFEYSEVRNITINSYVKDDISITANISDGNSIVLENITDQLALNFSIINNAGQTFLEAQNIDLSGLSHNKYTIEFTERLSSGKYYLLLRNKALPFVVAY